MRTRTLSPTSRAQDRSGPAWVRAVAVGAALAAVGVEAGLAVALLQGFAPLRTLLLGHFTVAMALTGIAVILYRFGGRSPSFLLLVVSTVGLGPLGALGAVASAALRWNFALRATPFTDWHASLFPASENSPVRALYERLVLRGAGPAERSTVAPFQEVLALGTVAQKHLVVTMISDHFRLPFMPSLRSALNNPEPAIRVQAATASARIEGGFLKRSMALQELLAADPEDPQVLLSLAKHHDEYAGTGLLDPARERSEMRRALDLYERLRHLWPDDPEVAEATGRLLLRLGDPTRALPHLEAGARGSDVPPSALALHLECLYRLGRLASLRALARLRQDRIADPACPADLRHFLSLWAGCKAEAEATESPRPGFAP